MTAAELKPYMIRAQNHTGPVYLVYAEGFPIPVLPEDVAEVTEKMFPYDVFTSWSIYIPALRDGAEEIDLLVKPCGNVLYDLAFTAANLKAGHAETKEELAGIKRELKRLAE